MGQSAAGAVGGGVHGFAPALTSFVGRAGAVAEVAGLLERRRLVTVTGPGGSGKTRLAAEVARRVAGRFADGVWLAELAALRDPVQVPAAVAVALGVRELPGEATGDAMARMLARQQLLVVLDNCEHVIEVAAQLCAGLLPACDDVRVLATSRESLHVAGEARYRLAPLTVPGPDDLADAGQAEAVALFAERARSTDVRFALDDQTRPAVARLVRRLDGMPLAIELAAARVEAVGLAQLLDCLDDRFALLTAGDRFASGRQRSLAATVEWSYQLLDHHERRVFRQLSVFPGPFTLEAAEAVAGQSAGTAVLHLVDCSLLVPPREDPDGRYRYVMLETLRAYGTRLPAQASEQEQAAAALARYALEVAEQAAAALETSAGELAAARWLDAEDATMRQALAWTLDHDAAVALRLAVALAPWWHMRGRSPREYPLLRQAAGHAKPGSDAWCVAQSWLGRLAEYSADLTRALEHYTAVLDAAADRPPSRALVDSLESRSLILANLDRIAEAGDDGRRALAAARELGYPAGEAISLLDLAIVSLYTGDSGDAVRLARQAEQMQADLPGRITSLGSDVLTGALMMTGDLTAAERVCATGLARARDSGDLRYQAHMLTHMTNLDLQAGRLEEARSHIRESLQIAVQTGGTLDVLNGLEACGYVCAAARCAAEALTLWAAHTALLRQNGYSDPPAEARRRAEPQRQARQALGSGRAKAAEYRGTAMSMAAAAEYALLLVTADPQPDATAGLAGLSERERELVVLVAQGRTDAQIAAQLYISIRTVSSHLDRIRDKTGCRRRADLTRLALTAHLV